MPATTLDAWAAAAGVVVIDVLAIDAEGLDPLVLDGAEALLAAGAVRMLFFEYHGLRAWRERSLRTVVERLDELAGMDCYLLQRGQALRLTGCWREEFETKAWSNVACAPRAERAIAAALAGFVPR